MGFRSPARRFAELNIEILCANSSQAKGRVERANRTLQDRLVKELRLAGIRDIDAGNTFLADFLERFNQRFAIPPAKHEDLHRPLNIAASRLSDILCHREQRYVGAKLSFHYDRKQIILERSDISENLGGRYIEPLRLRRQAAGVRWKRLLLPRRVFKQRPACQPHRHR
jgi:hypothetical protein